MEVNFAPDLQAQSNELSAMTGRPADELVQDVIAGYVGELSILRGVLEQRYNDIQSGKVQPVDGEAARAILKARTEAQRRKGG